MLPPENNSQFSRRKFTGVSLATTLPWLLHRSSTAQDANPKPTPGINVLETAVISQYSTHYHGWPTLIRRRDGELLVAYSGGRESHVCPFGRVELIRSKDDGKSWTFPRVVLDGPIDDRDAGLCETAQGSLLLTTFTSLAYEPLLAKQPDGAKERWLAVHNRMTEEQRKKELGVWMLRSTDGGTTWSERYPCLVDSPHGPVQISDGRILYAGVGLWDDDRRVAVAVSKDDGVSWDWLADLPVRPGDDQANYHELHLVECESGKLIVHIRNHNSANNRETLQTESTDGGNTWTTPHSIGVWGLPSHLLKLRDGRLLMTYGYRRKPFGNQARIGTADGESWSEPLIISGDGVGGDLGYPSTVELGGGDLYTVWYERMSDSPAAVLRGARWRLEAS